MSSSKQKVEKSRKKVVIVEETDSSSSGVDEIKQQEVPKLRKKREVIINDELKEYIDNNGLRCQKCGVRTKNKNIRQDTISGKSEGKSREIIRAECEKCGSKKTQFGNLEKLLAKMNI